MKKIINFIPRQYRKKFKIVFAVLTILFVLLFKSLIFQLVTTGFNHFFQTKKIEIETQYDLARTDSEKQAKQAKIIEESRAEIELREDKLENWFATYFKPLLISFNVIVIAVLLMVGIITVVAIKAKREGLHIQVFGLSIFKLMFPAVKNKHRKT